MKRRMVTEFPTLRRIIPGSHAPRVLRQSGSDLRLHRETNYAAMPHRGEIFFAYRIAGV
jgi:hypothetical protein